MSKSYGFMRRAIAFAGAVIITFNVVAAPQRARAVALTASVVASVAAIMTACGVSYWAASQTDAIDYLGGKIDAYLNSLETVPVSYEEWLGISAPSELFEVVSGGVMSFTSGIANKMLDFVRWFNQEEGVVSGGASVGNSSGVDVEVLLNSRLEGSASASWVDSDTLRLAFDGLMVSNSGFNGIPAYFFIPLTNRSSQTVLTVDSFTVSTTAISDSRLYSKYSDTASTGLGNWFSLSVNSSLNLGKPTSSNNYISLGFLMLKNGASLSGDIIISISGQDSFITDDTAKVTPSVVVSVPSDLAENDTFNLTPSVPLSQGMTVEQATDAVLDGVTSEDGLTSEADTVEGAAAGWGWLADLLERIRQAVQGTQEQTAPAQYGDIQSYELNLSSLFPFCIPWDIHRGLSLLVASPEAPSFEWRVPLPDGNTYLLSLDLSQFDGVAQVARAMEFLAFMVALAVATKKLIKW